MDSEGTSAAGIESIHASFLLLAEIFSALLHRKLGTWLASGSLRSFFKFTSILPPLCAAYMHYELKDGKHIPACVMAVLGLGLLLAPEPTGAAQSKSKKK